MKKILLLAVLIAASTTVVVAGLNSAIANKDNLSLAGRAQMKANPNAQKGMARAGMNEPCRPNASSTPMMNRPMRPEGRMEGMATPGGMQMMHDRIATGTATRTPPRPEMKPCGEMREMKEVKNNDKRDDKPGLIMRLLHKFFFGTPAEDPAVKEQLKKAVIEAKVMERVENKIENKIENRAENDRAGRE
jgi:hypothetical protein